MSSAELAAFLALCRVLQHLKEVVCMRKEENL